LWREGRRRKRAEEEAKKVSDTSFFCLRVARKKVSDTSFFCLRVARNGSFGTAAKVMG
jgi:hypothetical protein